jgi:hypothetical protein
MHGCGQGATLRSADVAKPKSAEVAIKVGISDEFVLVVSYDRSSHLDLAIYHAHASGIPRRVIPEALGRLVRVTGRISSSTRAPR